MSSTSHPIAIRHFLVGALLLTVVVLLTVDMLEGECVED